MFYTYLYLFWPLTCYSILPFVSLIYRDFKIKEKDVPTKLTEEKLRKCASSLVFGKTSSYSTETFRLAKTWSSKLMKNILWELGNGSFCKSTLLQRTQIQISAPLRWFTTLCDSCSRLSDALFWPLWELHSYGAHNTCRQNFVHLYTHKSLMCMADKLKTSVKELYEGIK